VGRVFSVAATIASVFIAASAATWWINSIAIGLFLRWVERRTFIRQGSFKACLNAFRVIFAGFSIATVIIVGIVYLLLSKALSSWLYETLPTSLYNLGYWFVLIAILVAVMVGVVYGISETNGDVGAARSTRLLI
jgi:hypothetical protein